MSFDDFLTQGWRDHGTDAEGVLARLPQGIALISETGQLPAFARLCVHVAGEHLGRWADGIALLEEITRLPFFDSGAPQGKAVFVSLAVLHRCAGNGEEEARCGAAARAGGDLPEASDRIRLLAVAASAFLGQRRFAEACRDFAEAVALASYGPTAIDPAARALAVAGNNLACELENQAALTDDERATMLQAAQVGRDFWAIAGGWMETERAEYRLAMSHIKAGDPTTALTHARACMKIVEENGSDPGEALFAHEAIARAQLGAGDPTAAGKERERMGALVSAIADPSFQSYCRSELEKLDADLASPPR
jgi:hypothetical protein